MKHSSIPPRLRESSFRDYEADIAEIVEQFPLVVDLSSRPHMKGKSVSTFAARLRDAMLSLATYQWPTELINREKFLELYSDIKVSQRADGSLLAGGNVELKEWHMEAVTEVHYHQPMDCYDKPPVFTLAGPIQATVLFSLAAQKLLRCSLIIQGVNFSISPIEIMDNYDVTLIDNKDGTFTLL